MIELPIPAFRAIEKAPEDLDLLGDRYLIEEIAVDVSLGGLIIPTDSATLGWRVGKVVAVGNGHRLERDETVPVFYQLGDVLMVEKLSGRELHMRGKRYIVINQTNVIGRFKE